MKKIIAFLAILILLAPLSLRAASGNIAVSPYPTSNIFDGLRSINSFTIPGPSGEPFGILVAAQKIFTANMSRLNQWLGEAFASINDKIRYASGRLEKIEIYKSVKNFLNNSFNRVRNELVRKFDVFSPQ